MEQSTRWSFAGFDIDPSAGVLRKGSEPVRIGPQALRALALLASRGGELVTREALQREIWGDRVHVDFEHGLNVCIRQVRAALGDDASGNQIIVTCPREGYRLGVPVRRVDPPLTAAQVEPSPETPCVEHTLVPSRIDPLLLRSPRRWGSIAAVVTLMLTGYLLASSPVRTPAPPARDPGAPSIAEYGPNTMLAVGTSQALAPAFFPRPSSTPNSEASMWYWRGRAYYDRSTGRKPFGALPYFERATRLDPNFAPAHAGLAVSYLDRLVAGIDTVQSARRAREIGQRAFALDPRSAEVHVALAELKYRLDADNVNAERAFVRAMELNGRSGYARQRYAVFLQEQRRFDDAIEQLRIAEELDPLSIVTSWHLSDTLLTARRWEESVAQAHHTLELDRFHLWSYRTIGQSLEALGRRDEAVEAYLKAGRIGFGHLGRIYGLLGRTTEAREILAALKRHPEGPDRDGVAIAYIYTGLGETQAAMDSLEKAYQAGRRLPFSLRVAPAWAPLRTNRGFNEFLKKNAVAGT